MVAKHGSLEIGKDLDACIEPKGRAGITIERGPLLSPKQSASDRPLTAQFLSLKTT